MEEEEGNDKSDTDKSETKAEEEEELRRKLTNPNFLEMSPKEINYWINNWKNKLNITLFLTLLQCTIF